VITLVDQRSNDPMKTLVRTAVSSSAHQAFHFSQALLGWMVLNRKPLMVNHPAADERFRGVGWDVDVDSLLSVPMMVKSEIIGVLTVYNKRKQPGANGGFTEEDQRLLAIIAAQSAQVVENARLHEAELTLHRMNEELKLASRIQEDLLPKESPTIPGYDVAGISVPAQAVGGDYFDFIPMEGGRYAVCLGDVSGKGLPASLLMANLQATLRGQSLLAPSACECINRANRLLYQSTSSEKFVTLFYGILDPTAHQLSFTNAGHENPFLLSGGKSLQRLTEGGIVLSIMEEFPYRQSTVTLAEGDLLVIFSDGISEAANRDHHLFGEDRIAEVILHHPGAGAREMVMAILEAARAHAAGAPQADDMTIVVLRRHPGH
jgi:sigma-B regulation protein RsbU (phosphoserine phosphatase)